MIKNTSVMITDECNSRCSMCGVWEKKKSESLSTKDLGKLFSDPAFREIEDLNITGGEPTLRQDLVEVTEAIINRVQLKKKFYLMPISWI